MSERRNAMPQGPMGGGMPGEKAKDFRKSMARLIAYMKKYHIRILIMFVFAIAGTAFNIIGPTILGEATTEIFNVLLLKINGTGGIDFAKIGSILLLLMGLYILSSAFMLIQGFIMTGISNDVSYTMRRDISQKINRMPLEYFESRTTGEVLSRVTNDVDTLQMGLNQSVTQLITSVTTIIGVFIMMLRISVLMTACAFVIIPVSMIVIGLITRHSQKYFQQQQQFLGDVNGQVEEIYSGHNIVKVFNKEEETVEAFQAVNASLYESAWKSQFFSGMMMPLMQFIGNLGYVMVALLGGYLTIAGRIQVGQIQSFFQYIRNFTQPMQQIAQVSNMLQSSAAAAERVFEFLEEKEEDQTAPNPVDISKTRAIVDFEHVQFGYRPEQIIIHDFSSHVGEGQKVAIVGPTGAGKTTMIKLLMRFYDVNQGSIKIDGHDLKEFNRVELRELFGMVLQDTWLFNGTIMENIRYGRLDATDEEVIQAAKAAHAHHFIMTQPEGYQMMLNEETSNISQGQKQLLTIARAILADNKIMILDEATSSVDTRTEIQIQKAMDALMQGRTSFIIAHRLSTIKDADLILVMKDGDIIEQGNHETLLEKNGFYAQLYNSQFEKAEAI